MKKRGKKLPDITYEFAMGEIGRNAGLETANGNMHLLSLKVRRVFLHDLE